MTTHPTPSAVEALRELPDSTGGSIAAWHGLDGNGLAELRVNGQRITSFPSYGGAREAAERINSALERHASDCAVHNAPALEPGPCDCGNDFYAEQLAKAQADPEWRAKWASPSPGASWSEEQIEEACRAHDAEDAAQTGEMSPWDVARYAPDFATFRSNRLDAMRAALASLSAPGEDQGSRAVPRLSQSEGWKLVPREPTKEMTDAAQGMNWFLAGSDKSPEEVDAAFWTAMYDAAPAQTEAEPGREELIELIMRETTDDVVADGWQHVGKPNILVQGCRYVRGHAPGYEKPEQAARKFAGFIADGFLALLSAKER